MRLILPVFLLAASALASALPTADPPATDDPSGVLGRRAPGWKLDHWFNSEPLALEDCAARWCWCGGSCSELPVLQRHRAGPEPFRGRGLVVIGAYHHKDPEPLDVETVRGYVKHYQFRFPVAVDPDWYTLKRWWLDDHERSWTSVSFLIDRRGVIRHVHPGGKLAPDTDDFRVMRAKIEALLAEILARTRWATLGTAAALPAVDDAR